MKKVILVIFAALILIPVRAQVKWHTVEEAASTKIGERLYLVDHYTSWCHFCKKMDKNTFSDGTVAKIMNKYFYPVKFDAESAMQVRWFGRNYMPVNSGRDRIHEFARGVKGFPTCRLYRSDGTVLQDIPGYYSPNEFVIVLWYFASGDYNRYAFDQYKKIFDKEIRPQMEKQLEI